MHRWIRFGTTTKVCTVDPPYYPPPAPLISLADQFTANAYFLTSLGGFANPVEKRLPAPGGVFPINHPLLHYSLWGISLITPPFSFGATVSVTNQFGDQVLTISGPPVGLLAPALKNQAGTPPAENHYTCYQCNGQPVNQAVTLVDQFDQWSTTVLFPLLLCTPARKELASGQVFPIVDPKQHYVCYVFEPADPNVFPATLTDQFVTGLPGTLRDANILCVPTDKTQVIVIATEPSSWGRLKQMYR